MIADKKEELRFETPEKPEMEDLKEVLPDTEEFLEQEKAEAVIKFLSLSIGDLVKEENPSYGNSPYFVINPRMVLSGTAPEKYKEEIELFKQLCTPLMIKQMTDQIKLKKKFGNKQRDKFYNSFCKKLDHRLKLKSLKGSEAVKYFTQEDSFKNCVAGLHTCVYHLLDIEEKLNEFKLAWFNKPIPNTQEWGEKNDGEYLVMTDSEALSYAMDSLTDDEGLWKQAVECGNTTQGMDEWAEQVLNVDGRGSIISMYDGCEECEDVNGITYYIYRNN